MKTVRTGLVRLALAASLTAGSVRADQPEMRAALENLRAVAGKRLEQDADAETKIVEVLAPRVVRDELGLSAWSA